ncbi:TetR/AcrR family transcriptional regulator [Sphingomonas solaris]|uniref:TetR/AcrR family transcriptional regulator n=1 Tax=Alterirhizorhabdus solaris TaxID=2529389 RepID=A0A558R8Z2_9SPHN|nr:TetR/AcrR family transcriptional regulator [Sphingomonas solaris]TVV75762.1 TetR/AcrR family transcriptional regulator [Sphingomonas solaris]
MGVGADASVEADGPAPGATGLLAFHQKRKQDSRDRLLAAAMAQFGARGYLPVSVEDIAAAAGVSRMTFYRHFSGKGALAIALFLSVAQEAMPRFLRIGRLDYRDPATVRAWIDGQFAADRENRALLSIFTQATVEGGEFVKRGHEYLADNIRALGEHIPAFALDPDRPEDRRRWIEAWLLIYELKDQSNHAALGSGVATDPLIIDIFTDRFVAFVNG